MTHYDIVLKDDGTPIPFPELSIQRTLQVPKSPFCQTPVGLGTFVYIWKDFAWATQSWQPPAPRKSTETGWGAALIQTKLVIASHACMHVGARACEVHVELLGSVSTRMFLGLKSQVYIRHV